MSETKRIVVYGKAESRYSDVSPVRIGRMEPDGILDLIQQRKIIYQIDDVKLSPLPDGVLLELI